MYNVYVGGENVLIDLMRVNNGIEKAVTIDKLYSFYESYLEAGHIEKLDNVKIIGTIIKEDYDDYYLDLEVSGVATMLCAITLKPIDYPFSTKINGSFIELSKEIVQNLRKSYNTIDILPIIWENILVEIPYRVVSDDFTDIKTSGNGWKIISEKD